MASKNFKKITKSKDPVEAFLTPELERELPEKQNESNGKEIKSKRWNMVIKPSLYEKMSKVACMEHQTVSCLVEVAIEQYIESRQSLLYKYDLVMALTENEKK